MTTYSVSLKDLKRTLTRDMKARQKRIKQATQKAASEAVPILRKNAPRAFGELQDSMHATRTPTGGQAITDAPHAAAAELGSRPHVVPLDALIKWVKLRGMQGLKSDKQLLKLRGTTTYEHARGVASQLAAIRRGGNIGAETPYSPIDAPEKIARAIQQAIAKNGTKPHHYALKSLPDIEKVLDGLVKAAMPDP